MRRFLRRVFMLSVVAGTAYAVWRWFESQRSDTGLSWESQPAPYPPMPRPENPVHVPSQVEPPGGPETTDVGAAWVEPTGDACPASHPVKAKMSSKIFHVEGGLNYDRIHPDRCYRDAAAAEADGLRKANR